jgi:hypothetical protein
VIYGPPTSRAADIALQRTIAHDPQAHDVGVRVDQARNDSLDGRTVPAGRRVQQRARGSYVVGACRSPASVAASAQSKPRAEVSK